MQCPFAHASQRPHPTRQLPCSCHIGHYRTFSYFVKVSSSFYQALNAKGRMICNVERHGMVVQSSFSLFGCTGVVPGCFYQQFSQVRVTCLGDAPRDTLSPLECSDGVSPSQLEKERAFLNRENTPASTTRAKAVIVSIPFRQRKASTRPRQRSLPACCAIRF